MNGMIARMCISLYLNSACVCVCIDSKAPYCVPFLLHSSSRLATSLLPLLQWYQKWEAIQLDLLLALRREYMPHVDAF